MDRSTRKNNFYLLCFLRFRWCSIIRFCVIYASFATAIAVLIFLYSSDLGLHTTFLRCESGSFINAAAYKKTALSFWWNRYATHAYNGHYTPLAFGLELLQAHVFGTTEHFWRLRQSMAFAALALCAAAFTRSLIPGTGVRRWIIAMSVGLIFISQPAMVDMFVWPFMVMQIFCLSLVFLSLIFILRYARHGQLIDLFAGLVLSYGTMHMFGVGAAFSVGAFVSGALSLTVRWINRLGSYWKSHAATLAAFGLLTLLHGSLMALRNMGDSLPVPNPDFIVSRFGVFAYGIVSWGLRSLWMPGDFHIPRSESFVVDNIYGWTITIIGLICLIRNLCIPSHRRQLENLVLLVFVIVSLAIYTMLLVLRLQITPPELQGLFIVGPRYIVFGSFFAVLLIVWLIREVPWRTDGALLLLPVLAIGAMMANAVFITSFLPKLWPWTLEDHALVWSELRNLSKEAFAQGQPLPEMTALTTQCPWSGQAFNNRMRRELGLPSAEQLQ